MNRWLQVRLFPSILLVMSLIVASATTPVAGRSAKKSEGDDSLAKVYVFYSDPPFDYSPGKNIRIQVASTWDRDKMERRIRKRTARAGGDVIILDRSFMEYDGDVQIRVTPAPGGGRSQLQLPTRTAFVVGHVATRIAPGPGRGDQRQYVLGFGTAWDSVMHAVADLGWNLKTVDTDSRYVTTEPLATSAMVMECDERVVGEFPAVFTIYVNNYADATLVRLDVAFVDSSTGETVPCRSVGAYETAFFRQLEKRIGMAD